MTDIRDVVDFTSSNISRAAMSSGAGDGARARLPHGDLDPLRELHAARFADGRATGDADVFGDQAERNTLPV